MATDSSMIWGVHKIFQANTSQGRAYCTWTKYKKGRIFNFFTAAFVKHLLSFLI
jgi:hypothetical protein